ncbi:MAG TPA: CsbD family protein [Rhodanobacteraceae bacterium]|nr:CsbD family protein [Rhodanobacteraceae bacterium]
MNPDIIKGRWKQLGARLKTQWAKLTDDDVGSLEGHRDYLIGRLQERYGWARDRAEAEVARFESELSSASKERQDHGQSTRI